jgi:hypothetical protein
VATPSPAAHEEVDKKVSGKKRAKMNKPATDEPSEKKKAKKAKRDDRQTRAGSTKKNFKFRKLNDSEAEGAGDSGGDSEISQEYYS